MKSSSIHFQNEKFTLIHNDMLTTTRLDNNDDASCSDYLEFSNKWMKRCFDWLKDNGRFCLNIPLEKNKGGQRSVGADLMTLAKETGFHYQTTIIWND